MCSTCGRPASFSVVQDGVRTWACTQCSEQFALGAGLASIASAMLGARRIPGTCPNCGMKQETAIETGLVGCPLCYEMLDQAALAHFGISRSGWIQEKSWSLSLPLAQI